MKVLFLGSPPFGTAVLAALIDSEHELVGVVTPPERPSGRGRKRRGSPLSAMAEENGLALLRPTEPRGHAFLDALAALDPGVLLVASYGVILGQEILDLAPGGALNVHASLLPRHRGASPIQHAILAGDTHTGISIQRMVLALDRGDVLLARKTEIEPDESAGELLARLAPLGGSSAVAALDLLAAGRATFTPQDESAASWAPLLKKADGELDFSRPAAELVRRVRAMTPWPGARAQLGGGQALGIVSAAASGDSGLAAQAPGTLLADGQGRFLVATGAGSLELTTVKPAGKAAMDGAAFLRGARLEPGEVLGA